MANWPESDVVIVSENKISHLCMPPELVALDIISLGTFFVFFRSDCPQELVPIGLRFRGSNECFLSRGSRLRLPRG